ncbi:helix-turn-helix domain-containing protein [Zhouia sp. PK063]|uniref:helix-turn-helix domain-containing protein n=1 Tax=Zhouia sp. PK063 TaxID=3373602 RepID=UPI00378CF421
MNVKDSKILYNCYFNRNRSGEQFIPEHVFSLQVAGTLITQSNNKTHVYKEGDFRLSRRNHLSKFEKIPPNNGEFKSLSIYLDQQSLKEISTELNWVKTPQIIIDAPVINLPSHPLYKSYMNSLFVYLQLPEKEQKEIMNFKIREAVLLLLKINPELQHILFDFTEPHKIDLEAFMQKNYRFNIDLKRFAYLSGRSLSTFKRDFEKIFKTTPSKWLLKRRLQEAYFLLKEKNKKASEIYLDLGFQDLSHFSRVFKKEFGNSPTAIKN